jgi:uncharacterized membrane protein
MLQNLFTFGGTHFFLRFLHVFFGIVWIGHLYYFNFVQGAFFNETDAATKSGAIQKLVPRALWWFRYGALGTFLMGLFMLMMKSHIEVSANGLAAFNSPYWINILTGSLMGTLMFLNVWCVIWPKQKIVIASATAVAKGGQANPAAAAAGARSSVASRTNTLFSIPLLFFMLAAMHFTYEVKETSQIALYWILALILIFGIEANALFGKNGPMTSIKGVITCGFVLTLVFAGLITALI